VRSKIFVFSLRSGVRALNLAQSFIPIIIALAYFKLFQVIQFSEKLNLMKSKATKKQAAKYYNSDPSAALGSW
jgi:hypothetical protein